MSGSAPRDRGLDNYTAKLVDALHFCRPATAGFNQLVLHCCALLHLPGLLPSFGGSLYPSKSTATTGFPRDRGLPP